MFPADSSVSKCLTRVPSPFPLAGSVDHLLSLSVQKFLPTGFYSLYCSIYPFICSSTNVFRAPGTSQTPPETEGTVESKTWCLILRQSQPPLTIGDRQNCILEATLNRLNGHTYKGFQLRVNDVTCNKSVFLVISGCWFNLNKPGYVNF